MAVPGHIIILVHIRGIRPFVCLSLLLVSFCSCRSSSSPDPVAAVRDGRVDLQGSVASVELAGRWAFWHGQFIYPFISSDDFGRFEQFPASWTIYGSERFPGQGYGSYALSITGLDPSVLYAFRFPGYSSAVRYFVNGVELHATGLPAADRKGEREGWAAAVVALPSAGLSEVSLVLHISNFHDIYPASPSPISFGSWEELNRASVLKRILMVIPFGAILAMGAYFIALFAFHRKELSCFWLGLLALVFALRMTCYDEFFLRDLFPAVSPALMFRLGYLSFALAVACFAGFVRAQYPSLAKRPVCRLIQGIAGLYALCTLLSPVPFFTAILVPFQAFTLLSAGYMFYVILRAVIAASEGARMFLAGFLFFLGIIIRDILISNRVLDGMFLAHYGILGIITAMAIVIVRHIGRAFNEEEALAENLRQVNASLVRFVPNEFLTFLEKSSITDICLGDNIQKNMCVMFVHLGMELPLTEAAARLNMLIMFNDILLRVNPVIQRYRGFIDKYLAEGLMVLFPDDSSSAVRCALEIMQVIGGYNCEREAQHAPRINLAAGIHRGELMLGTIGEAERMDSTVISDVVNTASRLRQFALTRGAQLVISADVAETMDASSPERYCLSSLGEVTLRGRDGPITVYEVQTT